MSIKPMSVEQLAAFLQERGADPARIKSLEAPIVEESRKYLQSTGQKTDPESVAQAATVGRAVVADKLKDVDMHGMPEEEIKKILGFSN